MQTAVSRTQQIGASTVSTRRWRWPVLAGCSLALAYSLVVPQLNSAGGLPWNQGSIYALVRALSDGTPVVDRYEWQTGDLSYFGGHYYSVRAPGSAFLALPAYEVFRALGVSSQGASVAGTTRREEGALGMMWALGLVAAALPAVLLVLLVARVVELVEPGLGPLSGITVGVATLVLPFSTMLFVHILSALLGFAAFAVLLWERNRRESLALVAIAGLLAGLAVTTEYPVAIVTVVLGLYAAWRRHPAQRAATYACGVIVGLVPLLLYNRWAFGSALHLSYADAIAVPGKSGHDVLGLNGPGLFGVGRPHPRVALELLFSNRGLLTLSPVLALAAAGTVLLYRRGWRAEALTIGGVALAFVAYDSGYVNPFGGDVPGPRFLIPAIPFLGVALALCYRRLPGPTLALAVASAVVMVIGTGAQPLLPSDDTGLWWQRLKSGDLSHTVLTWLGSGHGWISFLPFVFAVVAAVALAAWSTTWPSLCRSDLRDGLAALVCWLGLAVVAPIAVVPGHPVVIGGVPLLLIAAALGGATAVSAVFLSTRSRV